MNGYPLSQRAKYKFVIYDNDGLVVMVGHLYHVRSDKEARKAFKDELATIYKDNSLPEGYSFGIYKMRINNRYPKSFSWVIVNPCGTR